MHAQAYGNSGLTAEEVLEEILCDAMGSMNAFATETTERLAGEVGVFLRDVHKSVRKQEGGQKITIHNKTRAESMLQTYGSNASVEDAIRSVGRIVSQGDSEVKQKYSREIDSEGNKLTEAQAEFFKYSEVRDDEGRIIPVYQRTDYEFYTFKRKNLGQKTLGTANDWLPKFQRAGSFLL